MIEFLNFAFASPWHYFGILVYLVVIATIAANVAEAARRV